MPRIPGEESWQQRVDRILDELTKGSPLESSSIDHGRVRFIGGELLGESGAHLEWHGDVDIDGAVTISLTLNVTGNTVIGGTVEIKDNVTIKGNTTIQDNLTVTAQTILQGLTTLQNDLRVNSGGKIVIDGPVPFTMQNGAIVFANGTEISGGAFGIRMAGPGSTISAGSSIAGIAAGGNYVTVDGTAVQVGGHMRADGTSQFVEAATFQGPVTLQDIAVYLPNLPFKAGTGLAPGGLWVDPSDGQLFVAT